MPITLQHITSPTPAIRELIAELDAELAGPYAPEQRHGLSLDRIFKPNVFFLIAHLDDQPAGCGGIAFETDFAELKRMYVRPHARRHRVASAIVNRLEQEARTRGVRRLTLETGDAQQAALHFYERAGFARCSAFGQYITMPPRAIAHSVFFEKPLARQA